MCRVSQHCKNVKKSAAENFAADFGALGGFYICTAVRLSGYISGILGICEMWEKFF